MRRIADVIEYFLGFVALTVFGALAFASVPQTDATWRFAFLSGGALACVELAALMLRPKPVNRLIIGANIWLIGGAVAMLTKQWWLLLLYEQWQARGIVGAMLAVGIVATAGSPAGFVGAHGPRRAVLVASLALLVATSITLWIVAQSSGPPQTTLLLPLVVLALFNRGLRQWVAARRRSEV